MNIKIKAPITYYGGKTSMLPVILPMIPDHEVYTEVFCGGAAVLWAKEKAKNETINDILGIVVNFYEQLKTNYHELKKLINATLFCRDHHDKALMIIKNERMFSPVERAWAFWMASNFSYGNKLGGGLKYSNDQSMMPPQMLQNFKKAFTEVLVDRIENLHIENRDAIQVLESRNVAKAFHYIDPPYIGADQGHYKGYTVEKFEALLKKCEEVEGNFLLSNYKSDILDKYVKKNGWWTEGFTYRNKGMRKNDFTKREILVANYIPTSKLTLDF